MSQQENETAPQAEAATAAASAADAAPSAELITAGGTNSHAIVCAHCGSKVLFKDSARHVVLQAEVPGMQSADAPEALSHHWQVTDMFHFANVGFSHTVGTIKYLSCADCEKGPIGFHDTAAEEKTFNVCHARIAYHPPPSA